MKEITSIKQIQDLAITGFSDWEQFGEVLVKEKDDLLIFNYSHKAQQEQRWNFFECVSRGLIIDKISGEIIARPFDKFFNYGEDGRTSDVKIKHIFEKLDGSLGILHRNKGFKIATRGSFDSEMAIWATEFLKKYDELPDLPNEWTLLFEIIYPENRIIINYKDREDLVLLAIRNRFTGEYLSWGEVQETAETFNFSLPRVYNFNNIEEIQKNLREIDGSQEGYVVEFEDEQRFKFKGEEYLKLHRIISNISFKYTLEAVIENRLEETRAVIPEEFLEEFNGWVFEIREKFIDTWREIFFAFNQLKDKKENRKQFALEVIKNYKHLSQYLFALLDNKKLNEIDKMIYETEFKKRKENQDEPNS